MPRTDVGWDSRLLNALTTFILISGLLGPLIGLAKPEAASLRRNSAQQADLIIVGAGLAGLSAALEAGRSGAKVLVVPHAPR
jgi:NADPH-dependent 2,4-dienoyl-CoA reductase/sulfur reductase-like enzyme